MKLMLVASTSNGATQPPAKRQRLDVCVGETPPLGESALQALQQRLAEVAAVTSQCHWTCRLMGLALRPDGQVAALVMRKYPEGSLAQRVLAGG